MSRRHLALYLGVSMIWGCTWFFILKVVQAFGGGGVALRAVFGGLVLLATARGMGKRLQFGRWKPITVLAATTVAVQLMGFNLATPMVGTQVSSILASTIPMASMTIGRAWGMERITPAGYVGLGFGVFGVVLVVGFPTVTIDATFIMGSAFCIAGAIGAAYGGNYAKRHLSDIGYWEQTIGSFLVGGTLMLPLFIVDPPHHAPALIDYGYLAVLSAVSTGLVYVMFFKLVSEIGATRALTVEFMVTAIAVVVGALFLGERLSAAQGVGVLVIVAGCMLVLDLAPRRRNRSAMVGAEGLEPPTAGL